MWMCFVAMVRSPECGTQLLARVDRRRRFVNDGDVDDMCVADVEDGFEVSVDFNYCLDC